MKNRDTITKIIKQIALSWRLILFLLLFPIFWQMYKTMIVHVTSMFNEPLESMSHGWLVPLVSIYAVWIQRGKLRKAATYPSWTGLIFTFLSLIVYWFGCRGGQSRIEQFSLIGLLWSVPFAFWGWEVARLLIFPVGYMLFSVPLSSFLDFFTVTLRLLSTTIVCGFMNGVGYDVQRVGNALFSRMPDAPFALDVADGCSGIESFFAVMALTAAYAWLKQKTLLQKIILFFFAIPVAVIGNSVRLISDCLVAVNFGQDAVGGYYHDYSGFAIAFLNVFLVVQLSNLVAKLDDWVINHKKIPQILKESPPVSSRTEKGCHLLRCALPVVTVIMIIWFAVSSRFTAEPFYDSADFVAQSLPEQVLDFTGEVPLFCHNEKCLMVTTEEQLLNAGQVAGNFQCPACGGPMNIKSLGEMTDTPTDTAVLKRNYRSPDGMVYNLNVVIGGRNRYSIHRAEQCLPAQGFLMEQTRVKALKIADDTYLKVRKIDASRQGVHGATLVYWFASRHHVCCSHAERILLDVWDRSIHNKINRWVMFAAFIPSGLDSPESVARFEEFISELYPQIYLESRR
jgi:exosortase